MKNFFKNLSIQVKLLTGFGVIVIIMMVTGVREIILLKNLDNKREKTSNAVNTSYLLKESRFILNSELTLMNEIYYAEEDDDIDDAMAEHILNNGAFKEIYETVEKATAFSSNFKYNDENRIIRDSLEFVREAYETDILPVFERMSQQKKNLINIEIYYAEYLKISVQDSSNRQLMSQDALSISIIDDMNRTLTYVKYTTGVLTGKIKAGEQISTDISYELEEDMKNIYQSKTNETFIYIIFALLISVVISFFISNLIIQPIEKLRTQIEDLTTGNLPKNIYTEGEDEIGEMGQALGRLVHGLRKTAGFSISIGKSDFAEDYSPMSKDDVLGNSLLSMRDSLKAAKTEEEKRKKEDAQRNRASEGLTLFGDILRRYSDDISELSDEIISSLVKFMNANQGAVFILNDEDKENIYLDLQGAYAYKRKKYIDRKIAPGVGLVGAVFLEKYTMYLTEVPNDFVEIESGLGNENPKSILIVPLKIEERVLGVVELASFSEFEPYEIELVEKISESIASTLSTTRINARTAKLLRQSEHQAVKMREQEEEMLQNIEELKSTHEESANNQKKLKKDLKSLQSEITKLEAKEVEFKDKIDKLSKDNELFREKSLYKDAFNKKLVQSSFIGIVIFNDNYELEIFNIAAERIWGFSDTQVLGKLFTMLLSDTISVNYNIRKTPAENGLESKGNEILIKDKKGREIPTLCSVSEFIRTGEKMYIAQFLSLQKDKEKELEYKEFRSKIFAGELAKTIKIERMENLLIKNNVSFARKVESDDLIFWDDSLLIGVEVIDQQHKKWILLLNNLYIGLKEKSSFEQLSEYIREVIDYSDYHFSFEEKYFLEFNFIHKDFHEKEHKLFMKKINAYRALPNSELLSAGFELMGEIRNTVISHILEEDTKYAALFKENGLG